MSNYIEIHYNCGKDTSFTVPRMPRYSGYIHFQFGKMTKNAFCFDNLCIHLAHDYMINNITNIEKHKN